MVLTISDNPLKKIPPTFSKEDIRFLFLFKVIKRQVQEALKKEGKRQLNEDALNDVCANAAKDLFVDFERTPTIEEINQVVTRLKRKLG